MHGGCLCGRVRFELTAAPTLAGYCHCTRCQRRTGTGSSVQARIDGRTFRLLPAMSSSVAGTRRAAALRSASARECGAHLFSRSPDDPTQMSIRMAAFDEDPGVRPSYRQFVAYAAAWEPIPDDGLERFGEARPASAVRRLSSRCRAWPRGAPPGRGRVARPRSETGRLTLSQTLTRSW